MHRALELLVGFALVVYGAYALHKGEIRGKFRTYTRQETPGFFLLSVLMTLGIGLIFLLGGASWRN